MYTVDGMSNDQLAQRFSKSHSFHGLEIAMYKSQDEASQGNLAAKGNNWFRELACQS